MKQPRRAFLESFFRIMQERAVPYCVLRNYDEIYDNLDSDVDLAMEPEHLEAARSSLEAAMVETGHHFVLRTRYVNFSHVYWHPDGGFLRIDLETEIRWRQLPVLTAKSVVGLRRKYGAFYIPHPRHEAVIILVAAIWRGFISDRYRNQLARLFPQVPDPEEWRRTFRCSFGSKGEWLADFMRKVKTQEAGTSVWKAVRRALWKHAIICPPKRREFLGFLAEDSRRFFERVLNPPGICLVYASHEIGASDLEKFFGDIRMLYPTEKVVKHVFYPTSAGKWGRLGVRRRMQRLYSIFKGGLFMRCYQVKSDLGVRRVLDTVSQHIYPTRIFVYAENATGETWLSHVETGFATGVVAQRTAQLPNDRVIHFISETLEHYREGRDQARGRRGRWISLITDNEAQFTRLGLRLAAAASAQKRFSRVRFFDEGLRGTRNHFAPVASPAADSEQRGELSRNGRGWDGPLAVLTRAFRIEITRRFRLQPLLRRNSLVLSDGRAHQTNCGSGAKSASLEGRFEKRWNTQFPCPDLIVIASQDKLGSISVESPAAGSEADPAPRVVIADSNLTELELTNWIWQRIVALDAPTAKAAPGTKSE